MRYLAPTMAGWQLMAKVGAREGGEGRENSVEISAPMQMLWHTALGKRVDLSLDAQWGQQLAHVRP